MCPPSSSQEAAALAVSLFPLTASARRNWTIQAPHKWHLYIVLQRSGRSWSSSRASLPISLSISSSEYPRIPSPYPESSLCLILSYWCDSWDIHTITKLHMLSCGWVWERDILWYTTHNLPPDTLTCSSKECGWDSCECPAAGGCQSSWPPPIPMVKTCSTP